MQKLDDWHALRSENSDTPVVPVGPDAPVRTDEMSVALIRMTPSDPPITPHFHVASIEVYLVISGAGTVTVNGQASTVRSGAVVMMERKDVHTIVASGDEDLVYWAISTPPWRESDHLAVKNGG